MASLQEKQAAAAAAEHKLDSPTTESTDQLLNPLIKLLIKKTDKKEDIDRIDIHIKALDDLVNVNSLFTIAVFVGLSMTTPGQQSLTNRTNCQSDTNLAKKLITFEVLAFAFFLLSNLVAKVLKLILNMKRQKVMAPHFDRKDLMLSIAASSSVAGIVFLTLSMVYVIQIRLGKLSCGSTDSIVAVLLLCVIVGSGLFIYTVSMVKAVHASYVNDKKIAPP